MNIKHFDEARSGAIAEMERIIQENSGPIEAAAIIDDLFGRISVKLWLRERSHAEDLERVIRDRLVRACAQYWTNAVSVSEHPHPDQEDDPLLQLAWREGIPHLREERLRINDRLRHHAGWFRPDSETIPLWPSSQGPRVVVFHGFKGGAGRTTLLTSYALSCARRGYSVVVVDMDLDAPGVGTLLSADAEGTISRWGTVDFLLEARDGHSLSDYYHICAQPNLTGSGHIKVFPAGELSDDYLPKLARVDLDARSSFAEHPLGLLLTAIRGLEPDLILLDGRAGLSPAAGLLLSGIAHLHVLIATASEQSIQGLERVIHHLGHAQALQRRSQGECVVVQALIPDNVDASAVVRAEFQDRLEAIFRYGYYARSADEDDSLWSLDDMESNIAPHVAVPISYRARLAHFGSLDQIADLLVEDPEYVELHERLNERLGLGATDSTDTDGVTNG
jgi:MinD-like ATPase involved in chromosome partitioning or flagellar assembly